MEVSQQFLIDMALNIGGYVLAGLVSVVIYSLLHRHRQSTAAAEITPAVTPERQPVLQPAGERENRRIEFIKLGERPTVAEDNSTPESLPQAGTTGDRRNRTEIIRIARTMLKAGTSDDKIKRLIPISDAELSLLSMSKS